MQADSRKKLFFFHISGILPVEFGKMVRLDPANFYDGGNGAFVYHISVAETVLPEKLEKSNGPAILPEN